MGGSNSASRDRELVAFNRRIDWDREAQLGTVFFGVEKSRQFPPLDIGTIRALAAKDYLDLDAAHNDAPRAAELQRFEEKAHDFSRGMNPTASSLSVRGKGLGALGTFFRPSDAARPRPYRDNRTNSEPPTEARRYPRRDTLGTDAKQSSTSESTDPRRNPRGNDGTRRGEDRSNGRLARPAPRRCANLKLPTQPPAVRLRRWESHDFSRGRMSIEFAQEVVDEYRSYQLEVGFIGYMVSPHRSDSRVRLEGVSIRSPGPVPSDLKSEVIHRFDPDLLTVDDFYIEIRWD